MFGAGVVKDIRSSDATYVVELSSWKLATNRSPILYLNQSSLSKKTVLTEVERHNEMFTTSYDKAMSLKTEGGALFKTKNIDLARKKYLDALEVLKVRL